jgi:hypothetical protein
MTLRTAVCIYHRGRLAVAQRSTATGTPHDDDGGIGVLRFLWEPGNIERLRKGLQHVATLTPEGRKEVRAFSRSGVDLLKTITQVTAEKPIPIFPDVDFATGVWCDWAYLVNLDQNTFEIYLFGGGGYLPEDFSGSMYLSRFAGVDEPGPRLLKGFSFSQLPATKEEFIRALVVVIKEREIHIDSSYIWAGFGGGSPYDERWNKLG